MILDDILETLHSIEDGAAIAAPQIGILKRLVVIDMAKCFCHEIDHLDGIVFVDKVIEWM